MAVFLRAEDFQRALYTFQSGLVLQNTVNVLENIAEFTVWCDNKRHGKFVYGLNKCSLNVSCPQSLEMHYFVAFETT